MLFYLGWVVCQECSDISIREANVLGGQGCVSCGFDFFSLTFLFSTVVCLLGLFLALIILVLFVCVLRLGWYGFESHPDPSGVTFFVGACMVTFAVDTSGGGICWVFISGVFF